MKYREALYSLPKSNIDAVYNVLLSKNDTAYLDRLIEHSRLDYIRHDLIYSFSIWNDTPQGHIFWSVIAGKTWKDWNEK